MNKSTTLLLRRQETSNYAMCHNKVHVPDALHVLVTLMRRILSIYCLKNLQKSNQNIVVRLVTGTTRADEDVDRRRRREKL